ncbi:hypothetical protein P3X46_033253 [Hevea brasiliensis]|uniref:Uncharacterized protein n=1 Tax=Hevea brasiliensis TaxID=3981 RepID=A0ABQ9KFU8_HEVBR|nr:hypothetical protein P3X46_033253 [Hevea brasiliensis]
MAAISITKIVMFNLSGTVPSPPSLFLGSTSKVSRVCFTSASKYNEGRNAAEENRGRASDFTNIAKETTKEGVERARERAEQAKEQSDEMKEKAKERVGEMKENAKVYAYETQESAKGVAQSAAEKTKEGAYKAAETTEKTKEKARDYAHDSKKKAKEGIKKVVETARDARDGTIKVVEMVGSVGEKAEQTAKRAWDAAKGTTQKIKETVVGKEHESDDDKREKTMDEDVVDLRRPERGGESNENAKKRRDY